MNMLTAVEPNEIQQTPRREFFEAAETLATYYWLRLVISVLGRPRSGLRLSYIEEDAQEIFGLSPAEVKSLTTAIVVQRAQVLVRGMKDQMLFASRILRTRFNGFAEKIALDEVSINVLIFSILAAHDSRIGTSCRHLNACNSEDAGSFLGPVLDVSSQLAAERIEKSSVLVSNGLLTPNQHATDLRDSLRTPDHVRSGFFSTEPFESYLLRNTFSFAERQYKSSADFTYLAAEIALIRAALAHSTTATHVLLAGAPGVGKTELARYVANVLGWTAYEVRTEKPSGGPACREHRFTHYALGCRLLKSDANRLIIFDEAEDVFTGDHWTHVSAVEERHKGWTNRLLEAVTVPTIWISNSLDHIDPAYVRRFDYVLELRTPPRSIRRRLLSEATVGSGASSALIERIADAAEFTPADAGRIARVLPRAIAEGLDADEALERLAISRPNGIRKSAIKLKRVPELPFRLDWINVDTDLPSLIFGLRAQGSGSLLFSGPPGTGKTELARYLARELDRSLYTKKASNLLSPYRGVTEQLIAEAFEEADRDDAILLIDEADSFQRSWHRRTLMGSDAG